jgi:multiple sugar transport system substrate-binding protein
MNKMKNVFIFIFIVCLTFLNPAAGTHTDIKAEQETVILSVWSFTDEMTKFIEWFEEENPDITVELTIVPLEEYLLKLEPLLESGSGAPDLFAAEAIHVKQLVESGYWEDLKKQPYKADTSGIFPYIVEVGTDSGGRLRALSWQATPGGFFYRRSLAKQYLGTDNPDSVGQMLSTTYKFLGTARTLSTKSNGTVKIITGYGDFRHYQLCARSKPFIVNNKLNIDQAVLYYFDIAQVMRDEELTAELPQWSPGWFEDMNNTDPRIFGYILPTWGLHFVIKPNAKNTVGDWGLCKGPASHFWGGTWLGIYSGSHNKQAAWKFLRFVTLNQDTLKRWAKETGDFVSNKTVVNSIKNDFSDSQLKGQNHYAFFAKEALNINASLVNKYEYDIVNFLMTAIDGFVNGTMTKQEAISYFKAEVQDAFPEVEVK